MSCPTCDDAPGSRLPARGGRTSHPWLAALAVLALAACERETTGDPGGAPAPLPPANAELSGAPSPPPHPYAPTPPPSSEAPPAADYVPPEAPTAAPPPTSSGVVAMEPIPNPPEPTYPTRRTYLPRARVHMRRAIVFRRDARVAPHRRLSASAPLHVRHVSRTPPSATATATATVLSARAEPVRAVESASRPKPDDRGARLAALQGALAQAVQSTAQLVVPRDVTPDRPSDITLTLPPQFADAVRREAGRQGLTDAASSVSLSARLAGDGYTAMPEDAQVQPLQSGRPTRFHWTAISQAGARGPLQATLSAQLLGGGGDSLDLGVVKPKTSTIEGWRALGVGLLALALLAAVGWLGRSRRPRSRTDLRPSRPLDMRDGRRL